MTSTITDTHRRVEITEVRQVIVTEIMTAEGVSSRSVRILGDTGAEQPAEIMEIINRSNTKGDLEMKAPEQRF